MSLILTHGANSLHITKPILPEGYTQLSYIENISKSTYFDLEIGLKQTYSTRIDCYIPNNAYTHNYMPLYGGRASQYSNNYTVGTYYDGSWHWYCECNSTKWDAGNGKNVYNNRLIFNRLGHTGGSIKTFFTNIDGDLIHSNTANISTVDKTLVTPGCYLFSMCNNGSKYTGSALGKIYEFEIRDETDTDIVHLYPCLRNIDGVSGFYDIVRNKFLRNKAGDTGYHNYGLMNY